MRKAPNKNVKGDHPPAARGRVPLCVHTGGNPPPSDSHKCGPVSLALCNEMSKAATIWIDGEILGSYEFGEARLLSIQVGFHPFHDKDKGTSEYSLRCSGMEWGNGECASLNYDPVEFVEGQKIEIVFGSGNPSL